MIKQTNIDCMFVYRGCHAIYHYSKGCYLGETLVADLLNSLILKKKGEND